jgi:hypothetical protein
MIDLNDPLVIEFLRGAGWVKIDDNDVVIERSVLNDLIFDDKINEPLKKTDAE